MLLRMALDGALLALRKLDPAYEPLSWARASAARWGATATAAALDVDIEAIAKAVTGLVSVLETLSRDDSPLDWASVQMCLAEALQLLGEATDSDGAFAQAAGAYARACSRCWIGCRACRPRRGRLPPRALRPTRRAELAADLKGLRAAENALRHELAQGNPQKDPVGWAVRLWPRRSALRMHDGA